MSETSTCRAILAPYCVGNGLDVGAGGDPIVPWAICVDREENAPNRAHVGTHPTHLKGDAGDLRWFRNGCLDFLYSSHTLEDFSDTTAVLREWLRVLRPGGLLVLFLPDQRAYVADCERQGTLPNQAHQHADFSLAFVLEKLALLDPAPAVVTAIWPFKGNCYSFALILRKSL